MQQRSFSDELKYQYRHGGMHIRLIFVNTAVFLAIIIGLGISNLTADKTHTLDNILVQIFTLPSSFRGLLMQPWGWVTSIFAHFEFFHFLVNMLMLYFFGQIFQQFFTGRRLLHLYIVGGLAGGLAEIIAHEVFPIYQTEDFILGASGSLMAVMVAMAAYRPRLQVNLFGVLPVPLFVIALLYLLSDLVQLGRHDGVAHFAHLGGALIGYLSVVNLHKSSNIINMSETFGQRFRAFFGNLFKPRTRMKVERGGSDPRMKKTDEEYNMDAKARQQKTDAILDKISKSGYESLTKAEKEFLFSQSKK
jgi:membrane associated rhomboid family serine protease